MEKSLKQTVEDLLARVIELEKQIGSMRDGIQIVAVETDTADDRVATVAERIKDMI
jgi:hypothetical protein